MEALSVASVKVAHDLEGPSVKHGTTVEPVLVYCLGNMTSLSSGESFDKRWYGWMND